MSEIIQWQELTSIQRDELVAEKLMGWQRVQCDGDPANFEESENYGLLICAQCGIGVDVLHAEEVEHGTLPLEEHYTTNMDAAWKLLKRVPLTTRLIRELGGSGSMQSVRLERLLTWTPEWICIAALRAAGIEIER